MGGYCIDPSSAILLLPTSSESIQIGCTELKAHRFALFSHLSRFDDPAKAYVAIPIAV